MGAKLTGHDKLLSLGLLGLAVFAWLPDSYFRMVGWPWIVVWQGAFLIVLGGCLWHLRQFHQPFYRLGFGFDWLMVGLLVCLLVSSATSLFPMVALKYSLLVGCYVVLLYGVRNSRFSSQQLAQGLVWVGAIAAIISLVLWRPTADMWLSDDFYDAIRNRFPLGHHNFTGGYFVLVLPLAVGLGWWHSGWRRWSYGIVGLVVAIALYASGSRGAWLGGIVLVVIALLGGILRSRGKIRWRIIALSAVALCLGIVVLGSNPRVRALVPLNLAQSSASYPVVNDGPARDRVFMAQAAGNILQAHPLLGLGPGNLGRVYERYRPIAAGTGLNQVQQLHNTPLQIVVELGLGGAVVLLGMIVCLVRLWRNLKRMLPSPQERQLNLVLGVGFVGYGVSCLSDYQLENIPIATTLVILLAALIKQGDLLASRQMLQRTRRWLSLLILAIVALTVQFWLRMDLSLLLTHQGQGLIRQGVLTTADTKFYTAAILAPWDPTPKALGAQQLSELAQTINDEKQRTLQQEALNLYQQALDVAPDDLWFNQNVAVLAWQLGDVARAHNTISKVVQLSPRSKNQSYYLLGLTYQATGNTEAAIEALALESLINPQTLIFDSWQQDLAALKKPVFERVLQHYQTVLTQLPSDHSLRNQLREHIAAVRWWSDSAQPVQIVDESRLLLQALLTVETVPEQAVDLLDRCVATASDDAQGCRLLRAWVRPEEYLSDYLQTIGIEQAEQAVLRSHITTHRDLKEWLQSNTLPVGDNQRVAMALLYRSYYANQISSILKPDNLRQYSLPMSLNLFSLTWPRELLALDELVDQVRTERLGLPHPTRNQFQLTPSSV
ncbi:MAG: O-antigen ligase family protein [Cyanobacteria bacterium P01_F01_bin.13]